MALTAKGTGRPDFTTKSYGVGPDGLPYAMPLSTKGSQVKTAPPRVGTVIYSQRMGTIGRIVSGSLAVKIVSGTVEVTVTWGTLTYAKRLGTVSYQKRLGTVGYVGRLGTVQYQPRLGSIGRLGRVGTAHTGTVPILHKGREYSSVAIRDRVHLGQGSTWVGSWQHVGSYHIKTFSIWGRGSPAIGAGSFAIIAGMIGTGVAGFTGTYYGPENIGAGSFTTKSFTEAVRYVRPYFKKSGTYSGTISIGLSRQV